MRKKLAALLLAICTGLMLCACAASAEPEVSSVPVYTDAPAAAETGSGSETADVTDAPTDALTDAPTEAPAAPPATAAYTEPEDETLPELDPDGSYTSPEDVADYIHTFGTLPVNFITKREAQDLGWVSSQGNLWDVAPGMSIGGDYFGNREGLLPDGSYHECDVNYSGGYRQSERLIYGDDGSIYYTSDHYQSFTQLY